MSSGNNRINIYLNVKRQAWHAKKKKTLNIYVGILCIWLSMKLETGNVHYLIVTLIIHNCLKIRETVATVLSDFIRVLCCTCNQIIRLFIHLIDTRCGIDIVCWDIESEWSHLKPQNTTDLLLVPVGEVHNENLIALGLVAANSCKRLGECFFI